MQEFILPVARTITILPQFLHPRYHESSKAIEFTG